MSPNIPWHDITSTRDRLIHEYDDVDMYIVWDTVQNDLPILENELEQLLKKQKKNLNK